MIFRQKLYRSPQVSWGVIFYISVSVYVRDLEVNGLKLRLTKYKLIIYEEADKEVSEKDAQVIAQYLWEEGFIKKEEFPVEILRIED